MVVPRLKRIGEEMMKRNLNSLLVNGLCFFIGWISIANNASATVVGDPPFLEVTLESTEVFEGESTILQIEVHNADQPSPPSLKPLEESFDVAFLGEQSMNQSSTMIINGRISRQNVFKHVYQYRITPKSIGTVTIPALSAKVDGVEIKSNPLNIRVTMPAPQDDVLVEIITDQESVYPTQSFEITLRILIRSLPDSIDDPLKPLRRRPPHLSVPWIETPEGLISQDTNKWLNNLLSDRGYGFTINELNTNSGFLLDGPRSAMFDLLTGKEKRTNAEGETIEYFRYELSRKFQAMRSGDFQFGPVLLKGTFVADRQFKKIGVVANPVRVLGKSVPNPRPDNFIGGIGNFTIKADATPSRLRVGDPFTLTLDVTALDSSASLEMVAAPDLNKILPTESNFEVIDKSPVGRIEGNSKVFVYGVRPKAADASLPELVFTTFDPKRESFVEIKTPSIALEVVEAKSLQASDIVGAKQDKSIKIQTDRSGIYQGTAETYPIRNDLPNLKLWSGIVGTSWLASLGMVAFVRLKANGKKNVAQQRRSKAKLNAMKLLANAKKAMEAGDHPQSRFLVRQSICELFANSLQLNSEGLTTNDILEKSANLQLKKEQLESLRGLLHSLDAEQYGGKSGFDSDHFVRQAEELLTPLSVALQEAVRKGSKVIAGMAVFFFISVASMSTLHANTMPDDTREKSNSVLERLQIAESPQEFASLAGELENLRDAGVEGGAIFFHIGNAWFRAGQFGKAIFNYRFAKLYLPQDSYLDANLTQALSVAPGTLKVQENLISDKVIFWSGWLSYPFKIQLFAILLSASAFFFAVGLLLRRKRWVAVALLLMGVGTGIGIEGFMRSPHALASRYGVVVSETIARKGMGESMAPAFDKPLQDGAEFEIIQSTSQWTLGHFSGIGEAWVRNDSIIIR
jgi:hypothetical protein